MVGYRIAILSIVILVLVFFIASFVIIFFLNAFILPLLRFGLGNLMAYMTVDYLQA